MHLACPSTRTIGFHEDEAHDYFYGTHRHRKVHTSSTIEQSSRSTRLTAIESETVYNLDKTPDEVHRDILYKLDILDNHDA